MLGVFTHVAFDAEEIIDGRLAQSPETAGSLAAAFGRHCRSGATACPGVGVAGTLGAAHGVFYHRITVLEIGQDF